uniref:Integrin, alpha 8 n=1 Tax=Gadus morhua TaxID=8049 RepID=A0A8C5AZ44_GADMO
VSSSPHKRRGADDAPPHAALKWSALWSFNIQADRPAVYRGPGGSYFGYSVDFYQATAESNTMSVLVGAPKANTSQPGIVEAGAVYYCPWPGGADSCRQIPFDNANNRMIKVNGSREPLEFKSHQWFGASVRTHKGKVVACAPLYHWRTVKLSGERDPVGTCYVAVQNFSAYAEYSPCRTNDPDPEGQGFCQAGFSVDFTKVTTALLYRQVMTAGIAEILNGYSLKAVLRRVPGEKHTSAAADTHDDSYLGYSVAVGEFTGDSEQELIAGVPRGAQNFGYVSTYTQTHTGSMASYFGYSVAVADLNGDGMDDVLVGAPLYMEREMESKPREVGRVYLYLQLAPLTFSQPIPITGTYTFGRFGTAIATLGDINQDGFNDVAVGCPFGGDDRGGRVLIFNGRRDVAARGLALSQELRAAAPAAGGLPGYGFTLRGGHDLDNNHYPGRNTSTVWFLLVFQHSLTVVARAVVFVDAWMVLTPKILNADDRQCVLPDTDFMVTWLVNPLAQPLHSVLESRKHTHHHTSLNIPTKKLLYTAPALGLTPLRYVMFPNMGIPPWQAYILLDCGEDNLCIPDLQLSASMDRPELVICDENLVMLTITVLNRGEGAYETELHATLPAEADYIGVERRVEGLSRLNCEYRLLNDSRMVVCDLGNPMVSGTEYYVVQRVLCVALPPSSSNKDNPDSNPVTLDLSVVARSQLDLRGVSHPSQVVLPFPRWEPKEKPLKEEDVGPQVTHIYELHNTGPSSIREAELQVGWPSRFRDENLLYIMEIKTDGPISCRANGSLNPLGLQLSALQDTPELLGFLRNGSSRRHRRSVTSEHDYSSKTLNCSNIICLQILCVVGRLDRGQSAVVKIRSRLWAHTFLQRRNDPYLLNSTVSFMVTALPYRIQPTSLPHQSTSVSFGSVCVGVWCGFFDRARPPVDDDISDREQLTSDQSADA